MRFFGTVIPKRIVYLLDVSGSISHGQRIAMRDELNRSVARLDTGQQYQVVLFDHDTYYQCPRNYITVGENSVPPCVNLFDSLRGYGGSDVDGAIRSVLDTYPDVDMILVVTDYLCPGTFHDHDRVVFSTLNDFQRGNRAQHEVHELIDVLRRFPQNAKVQIEHCYKDRLGMLKWDLFELLSVEGNESNYPRENENVIIWIKPISNKEIEHGTKKQT